MRRLSDELFVVFINRRLSRKKKNKKHCRRLLLRHESARAKSLNTSLFFKDKLLMRYSAGRVAGVPAQFTTLKHFESAKVPLLRNALIFIADKGMHFRELETKLIYLKFVAFRLAIYRLVL